MNDFEREQVTIMHRMVTIVHRTVIVAMLFGFLITLGLAGEVIRTENTVQELRKYQDQVAELRTGRASDLAQQASRNCTYTKDFVRVFHTWATSLDDAERRAASEPGIQPAEKSWHDVRIGTYAALFQSLNDLGTNACPKATVTP
jgi:hypothetical protein